jgi:hypothetical protein
MRVGDRLAVRQPEHDRPDNGSVETLGHRTVPSNALQHALGDVAGMREMAAAVGVDEADFRGFGPRVRTTN